MSITTRIELAFGANLTADPATWTWTDVSVYALGSVTVRAGRPDEASQMPPTVCSFRLKNTDGRFSPRLPSSPYYPNVRRQTPVRISLNPGTGYVQVFQGYVDVFVPSWPSGNSEYAEVAVTASGSLRRLGQGNNVLRSALYRAITTATPAPSAYWPAEENSANRSLSSPIDQVPALQAFDAALLGSGAAAPGTAAMVSMTGGGLLIGNFPASGPVTAIRAQCVVRVNDFASGEFCSPFLVIDGTDEIVVMLQAPADGGVAFFSSAAGAGTTSTVAINDGLFHEVRITSVQSGGNVITSLYLDGVLVSSLTYAGTVRPIIEMDCNASGFSTGLINSIGHFAIWNGASSVSVDTVDAMNGHSGEMSTDRLTRLCLEEAVPLAITGTSDTTMGPQGADTFLNLLRECEAADGGILYDGQSTGLNYLARKDRYNLAVSMALDTKRQQVKLPFAPVEDDQRVRNDWTVTRKGGSFARVTDPVHIAANGLYDASVTLNLASDSNLPSQAGWRVHLGTVEEMRVPGLSLQLIDRPELWSAWLATTLGERITAANLPAQYPPGILDMILEGYTQTWDSTSWMVAVTSSPYQPWNVATLGSTFRLDAASQTLAANLTPGSASLSLATASGHALFTTSAAFPADVPVDINVGGWSVHATAASGGSSPQTLTTSASPNTSTIPAGTAVSLGRPAALAL